MSLETFNFIESTWFSPFVVKVGSKNKLAVFNVLLSDVPKLILKEALLSFIMYNGKES